MTEPPLPIAALMLRARNAKSAKERHDLAYFGWEASVRLAVAANPPADRAKLAMPSTGDWVAALELDERDFDHDTLLAVHRLLAEEGCGQKSAPRSTTAARLLAGLPAYRNAILGHGAVRDTAYYERAGVIMAAGLEAAWTSAMFLPEGARLVCVDNVEIDADGRHFARVLDLSGVAASLIDPRGVEVPASVLPRRLYVVHAGDYRSVHPWLLFEAAELRERVLFFNGRGRAARYLDYVGGEQVKGKALGALYPSIEADLDAAMLGGRVEEEAPEARDPSLFGDYRILDKLGEGGMGIVYLARQLSLERLVALKKLPQGASADPVAIARFHREISALARCEHPNIVKILAAGDVDGQHYYAMELVEGADLSEVSRALAGGEVLEHAISNASMRMRKVRADEARASTPAIPRAEVDVATALPSNPRDRVRALAEMFRDAAGAVAHLHENGIIHRDVKPANLMVTNGEHRIVLMDLGLAAVSDGARSLTRDKNSILGTLRYLPPEQLQRSLVKLDGRADIYSLGATFYELLTQKPFFDEASEAQLIEKVLRQSPVDPRVANPSLPRDLAVILTKATDKDPKRRYVDANALARDLDAYLGGRPISARPPTIGYLLRLAIRRHRAIAAVIATAIVVAATAGAWFLVRERRLREEAEVARDDARAAELRAQRALAWSLVEQGRQELLAHRPARAAELLAQAYPTLHAEPMVRFLAADAARELVSPTVTLAGHHDFIKVAAFSPDGRHVVTASVDHTARLWSIPRGEPIAILEGHRGAVLFTAFSPNGQSIITTSADRTARLWDVSSRRTVAMLVGHTDEVVWAAYNPDGTRVATAGRDGTARVWDAASGALVATLEGHAGAVRTVGFSPDGQHLATASDDRTAKIWDARTATLATTLQGHTKEVESAMFSPDSQRVLTAADDHTARLWDARTGVLLSVLEGHTSDVVFATFSPDGERIVTASSDATARLWNAKTAKLVAALAGHAGNIVFAAFSPDGKRVVTASRDHSARLWDARTGRLVATLEGHTGDVWFATFSADGEHVLTTSRDGTARIWNARAGQRVLALEGHAKRLRLAAFSFDGRRAVTASADATARVWDARSGKLLATLAGHSEGLRSVAFSPDGRRIVTASDDKTVRQWDASSGALLQTFTGHTDGVNSVAFSPDGRYIATASADKTASLIDVESGAVARVFEGHGGQVLTARVSPDGQQLLTCSEDKTARLWNIKTGQQITALQGHTHIVFSAAFSPDGRKIATAAADSTGRIWDAATGKLLRVLEGHADSVWSAAFSSDGQRIATASADQTARLWDVASGKQIEILEGHTDGVTSAAFSADGGWLITSSLDGTALIWDVHLEDRAPAQFAAAIRTRALGAP